MADDTLRANPDGSPNGHRPPPMLDLDNPTEPLPLAPDALFQLLLAHPHLQRAIKRDSETPDTKHELYDALLAEAALHEHWEEGAIITLIREVNVRNARREPAVGFCMLVIHEAQVRTKTGDLDFARERLLDTLSDTWGLQLKAVIRHGTENTLWHLQLVDGREIQLGTSKDLSSQSHIRTQIFDVTGHFIPRYSQKDMQLWDHHMELLALVAVTVDTPEMTRRGQAKSLLQGYLDMEYCQLDRDTSSEEWEGLALANKPFIRQSMLFLSAKHMWLTHVRIVNTKMAQSDLFDLLRLLGGRRITIALEHPKKTSRSVWRLPILALQDDAKEGNPLTPLTLFNSEEAISN